MSIYITNYSNGVVNYLKDNIPSKMVITEEMIKTKFPAVEKTYPMILGLINEQLTVIIAEFHTEKNHSAILTS